MKVLDVGCGENKYVSKGGTVIGVDFYNNKLADVKHDLNKFPYPFKSNSFDTVYCSHCLEHLDNPLKVLVEFHRLAKPNSTVIIRVPHASSMGTWANITHKRGYSSGIFNYFGAHEWERYSKVKYKIVGQKLKWKMTPKLFPVKILDAFLTFLANLNLGLCERYWCYWVGGFDEIIFEVEVIK